ncbi:MAG: chorismate lyase [Burkholderiaceae bacterium]
MTKQLHQRYATDVTVHVLRDRPGPLISDKTGLCVPRQDRGHVREVVLHGGGRPLVAARTVFTSRGLRTNAKLTRLGSRPLGELLFDHGKAQWTVREYAKLTPQCPAFALVREAVGRTPKFCWARRSLFLLDHFPLLVTEIFLPAMFENGR